MAIRCAGACGNPACTYEAETDASVKGHIYGTRAKAKRWPEKVSVGTGTTAKAAPPVAGFYPPLKSIKPTPPPTAAPPSAGPVGPIFDSSALWKGLGDMGDVIAEATLHRRIFNVDAARAKALDAGLQQMGWRVEANAAPVTIPYWLPFGITIVGVFALPALAALVPWAIRKARERTQERAAKKAPEMVASAVVPTVATSPAPMRPPAPPGAEEPEELVVMKASPPPFGFRAMPWHAPQPKPRTGG